MRRFLEEGLGEIRGAVVEEGRLVEMHVERVFDGPRAGARWGARITTDPSGRAMVRLGQTDALLDAVPPGLPAGRLVEVELVREAIPEPGRLRPARARIVGDARLEGELAPGPDLALRLEGAATGFPEDVRHAFEDAWEEAESGRHAIAGGLLLLAPTPAFLAIDIDGRPDPAEAARAIARLIRLFGIGGNIAIDFPTKPGKGWRHEAAEAFDSAMAGIPHERTAINGFGLMQVVRPRMRASILDRAMLERDAGAALALVHRALREPRPGPLQLAARPAVIARLRSAPALVAELQARAGRPVDLVIDPSAGEGDVRTREA